MTKYDFNLVKLILADESFHLDHVYMGSFAGYHNVTMVYYSHGEKKDYTLLLETNYLNALRNIQEIYEIAGQGKKKQPKEATNESSGYYS